MKSTHVRAELLGNHLRREVGSGRPLDEELVFREARVVHVRNRDRRGFGPDAGQLEADSFLFEQTGHLPSECILRKTSEKGGWNAESGQRASGVERSSARRRALRAVIVVYAVDQSLACDHDHGRISPEPLVIIRVSTM